jgi:hypothetical protein
VIARRLGQVSAQRTLRRIERPETIGLSVVLAALATVGWLASPFWLAVAIGLELAIAGLGAVWLIGPAFAGLGLARYATLATASVAVTLFGRVVIDRTGLMLVPVAVALLYGMLWLELRARPGASAGLLLDLALVAVVFCAAAGVSSVVPAGAWPPSIGLLVVILIVPALRAAEARGQGGVRAVGQALLHLLAVGQVGAGLALLRLPGLVGAAVLALAFHAWGGATEALDDGASPRAVILEFGALGVIGLVVALLLQNPR